MEDNQKQPRRSPAQKAMDGRIERCKAEVNAKHPEYDELTFALWGVELFVTVWQGGKVVGHYEFLEEV